MLFEIYKFGAKWSSDIFGKEHCINGLSIELRKGGLIGHELRRHTPITEALYRNSIGYVLTSYLGNLSNEWLPTLSPFPDNPGSFLNPDTGGEASRLSPRGLLSGWYAPPNTSEGREGQVNIRFLGW